MNVPPDNTDPGGREPIPPVPLASGPMTMLYAHGDLRSIRWNGSEIIRRIYGAVRDRDWGTVPSVLSGASIDTAGDSFRITYTSTHRAADIHFVWRAEITGDSTGLIRLVFDGEAHSDFLSNRIGLCVLHPIRECAGAACRIRYSGSGSKDAFFPDIIASEQPIKGFSDLSGLAHEIEHGVWAELSFEGDVFETEDQRNWIDASFKTYSTPLRLPFPRMIPTGTHVRQIVTLALKTEVGSTPGSSGTTRATPIVQVRIDGSRELRPPRMGLGFASHGLTLTAREAGLLSLLGLSHMRVDVKLADPGWMDRLWASTMEAMSLGVQLEVAIHLPRTGMGSFGALVDILASLRIGLARVMIFREGQRSTLPEDLCHARALLRALNVPLGAGTNGDLYQLNLQRPPAEADFICWSMNPQVHASDAFSIAETPEAAAHQLSSVQSYYPGRPLVVSPITLKPRFNPVSSSAGSATPPGELPPQVDPRQASVFGAAWTLAMAKAIAEGGAESITFFETTGWRGVMETEIGPPLPGKFPSVAGAVFPAFHVLADIGEYSEGVVVPSMTDNVSQVASLMLRRGTNSRLLLANLAFDNRRVSLPETTGRPRIRRMDDASRTSLQEAMHAPEHFRKAFATQDEGILDLPPYSVTTLDFSNT